MSKKAFIRFDKDTFKNLVKNVKGVGSVALQVARGDVVGLSKTAQQGLKDLANKNKNIVDKLQKESGVSTALQVTDPLKNTIEDFKILQAEKTTRLLIGSAAFTLCMVLITRKE